MLDACLTKPVLKWDSGRQSYSRVVDTDSLIRDVNIITDLLLCWKIWDKADLEVWSTAFSVLEVLLSGTRPSCDFNIKQLQSSAIVNRLLLICLVSSNFSVIHLLDH